MKDIHLGKALFGLLKYDNLHYNILGHLVAGTNDSLTKRLMFQVLIFFFLQNSLQKSFQFIFSFFYDSRKIKIKSLSAIIMKKNIAWNITRLVAGSFVQTNQRPSLIYHRLTDFWIASTLFAFVLITFF